jgi:hypothetical protein
VTVLKGKALSRTLSGGNEPVEFTAVPYYAWDHRKPGEMMVWIPEDPSLAVAPKAPTIANTSTATASHLNPSDTLDALSDGDAGKGPADQSIPRFTWWDHRGGVEWVQYAFREPKTVSGVEVHWFDDTAARGGCAVPASWKVLYRDGTEWKPVKETGGRRDGPVASLDFEPVKTNALRLEAGLQDGRSGGVLEWSVRE